ncbi:cupin domain-containing protein [Pendulispora rubella]|uniref:Cupin domain-containing protein n=1 Tax=Pendulispora rubella TaxID=2741070 RepID=A0ABZ2L336_9BACT
MNTSDIHLQDWFHPIELNQFRQEILGRQLLSVPPRAGFAEQLLDALRIRTMKDAFDLVQRGARTVAWFQRMDGTQTSAPVPLEAARRLYEAGTTLYVREIREYGRHEQEMANLFGVSPTSVQFTLFCTRRGGTTAMHFDAADIITVQLKGRKVWRIAPNAFAPLPLLGWDPSKPVHPSQRLYAPGPPPVELPANATIIEMTPGAVVHMPRGFLHETASVDEDSLSLNITIVSPTRAEVALHVLKNELLRDEWWREPAYNLQRNDASAPAIARAISTRLSEATSRISPQDVAPVPAGVRDAITTRFLRAGQASFGVSSYDRVRGIAFTEITRFEYHRSAVERVELPMAFVPACDWVNGLTTGNSFDVNDLVRAAGVTASDATRILRLLEDCGLVRIKEGATSLLNANSEIAPEYHLGNSQ